MADAKVTLEVFLKSKGIEPTTKELKTLNAEMRKTSAAAGSASKSGNVLKRNLEGVSQRAGSTGKDFARMSQGMGGLVAAYATVAANVFALSSAFLVLRRAADLSSMIKSAEDFSNRFGVSVTRITEQMQDASGGALAFAEALPSINKAVSAGIGIDKIEQLTIAATKAAQTFGGSTTEALSRFISASQRGRVEIIQTLGVVIKTEQAYKDYAATIGKTALELTAFDRQQAILNATIEESQKVFAGVTIDPNPFTQLLVTLTDVKDTIITFVTDGLTPMISLFNQSKDAALALIAVIAASVGGRIFPEISRGIVALQTKSIASTRAAVLAAADAAKKSEAAAKQHAKNTGNIGNVAARKRIIKEKEFLNKRKVLHASFDKELFNSKKELNVAILTEQRAALARQEKAIIAGKGIQKGLPAELAVIKQMRRDRDLLTSSTQNLNIAESKRAAQLTASTSKIKQQISALAAQASAIRSVAIAVKSNLVTGFSKSFAAVQSGTIIGIKRMILEWKLLGRTIGTTKSSLNVFSSAVGRTAGIVAGGFAKMLSAGTSLLLIVSLLRLGWEFFGDSILGISKEQRILIESFKELGETLDDITKRTDNFAGSIDGSANTMSNFVSEMEFVRGTLDSTLNALRQFKGDLGVSFNVRNIESIGLAFSAVEGEISQLLKRKEELDISRDVTFSKTGVATLSSQVGAGTSSELEGVNSLLLEAENKSSRFKTILDNIIEETTPKLISNFISLNNLLDRAGLNTFGSAASAALRESLGNITKDAERLVTLLEQGKGGEFFLQLEKLSQGDRGQVISEIVKVMEDLGIKSLSAAGSFVGAGRALTDTNDRLGTFFSGIDKLRSASVPNKEQFNFLLDIERALTDLEKAAKGSGATKRVGDAVTAEDLSNIKKFVDIASDDSVEKAIDKTNVKLKIFKDLILDSIVKSDELKIITLELQTLKREEIRSDEKRLNIIGEIESTEIKRIQNLKDSAIIAVKVQEENISNLKKFEQQNTLAIAQENSKLKVLEAQVIAYNANIEVIKDSTKTEQERLKIELEINKALQNETKILLQIEAINLKTSIGSAEHTKALVIQFNLRSRSLALEQEQAQLALELIKVQKLIGLASERGVLLANTRLELLKAQTLELERQKLFIEARELQDTGLTFTAAGIQNLADIFARTLDDTVRGLAPVTETLGKGFAKTAVDTLDSAVDKLFEGAGFSGFLDNLVETLKAGLRETFAEAIKNQIKDAFSGLFSEARRDIVIGANTTAVGLNTISQGTVVASNALLITALGTVAAATAAGGVSGGVGSFFGFGSGGITPGPITPFASGGVTSGPQLALIGEGDRREAVVPLPNNKEIPVQLSGDGGGDTISIEQNFDFRNADAGTITQLRAQAKAIEDRTFGRVFSEINKGGKFAKISGRR